MESVKIRHARIVPRVFLFLVLLLDLSTMQRGDSWICGPETMKTIGRPSSAKVALARHRLHYFSSLSTRCHCRPSDLSIGIPSSEEWFHLQNLPIIVCVKQDGKILWLVVGSHAMIETVNPEWRCLFSLGSTNEMYKELPSSLAS